MLIQLKCSSLLKNKNKIKTKRTDQSSEQKETNIKYSIINCVPEHGFQVVLFPLHIFHPFYLLVKQSALNLFHLHLERASGTSQTTTVKPYPKVSTVGRWIINGVQHGRLRKGFPFTRTHTRAAPAVNGNSRLCRSADVLCHPIKCLGRGRMERLTNEKKTLQTYILITAFAASAPFLCLQPSHHD